MRATFAKIYLENFRHNLREIKKNLEPGVKSCIAVKADSYGHGSVPCSKICEEEGVDFLAVATVDEGVELRIAGIKLPILVLSVFQKEEADDAVKADLTPLVFDFEYIDALAASCKKIGKKDFPVHIAVDSGMGRIGCYPEDAGKIARKIVETGFLKVGGICTHFAASDSDFEEDRKYTEMQFERFCQAVENVRKEGIDPGIRHCCNSAATLDKKEYHLDMCRSGITAYGYYPDGLDRKYFEKTGNPVDLKPVMALVSKIVCVRPFKKGMSVSYGHTWTAAEDTTLGVLPIGYADGLFRRFADGLNVAVDGKNYPLRGRICMDQCMIDLGKKGSESDFRWKEAVIFGPEESGALQTAQDLADKTGTISYEITSALTKRVKRVYIEG